MGTTNEQPKKFLEKKKKEEERGMMICGTANTVQC